MGTKAFLQQIKEFFKHIKLRAIKTILKEFKF